MMPLFLRLVLVFIMGATLGSFVNWAIYALAWNPRAISPWSRVPAEFGKRRRGDRVPILGWLSLRREAEVFGRGHWVRPLLLELGVGVTLVVLYWWDVVRAGNIADQVGVSISVPMCAVHWQFLSHTILFAWMLAASFIDIDEKIIPDDITVSGTLIGLVLAALVPMSMLPSVVERVGPTIVSKHIEDVNGGPIFGDFGEPLWLEPVTAIAPRPWDVQQQLLTGLPALLIGLACYGLWCFALAPRIWRGSRGAGFAIALIGRRVAREFMRPPLLVLLLAGALALPIVWLLGGAAWAGLFSSLVGLVGGGGIVWAVRLIGSWALKREAMGFGDVTLMMMIGTFIGWQASLISFFLAPFAGLFIGIAQFVLRRDDVIPYGPFLCLATAGVVVMWAPIWEWAQPMFAMGGLVPAVLVVCLALLGIMLAIWRFLKLLFLGAAAE